MFKLALMLPVLLMLGSIAVYAATELSSVGIWERQGDLFVDARYEDRDRTRLIIDASDYQLSIFVPKPEITVLTLGGENVIESGVLSVESGGKVYTSENASSRARLNIWRFGPHFYEVYILDFTLTSTDGTDFPGKAELVFYCYPEKFHVQAFVRPSEDVSVDSAALEVRLAEGFQGSVSVSSDAVKSSMFSKAASEPVFAAVGPDSVSLGNDTALISAALPAGEWNKGDEPSAWLAILPAGDGPESLGDVVLAEVSPLDSEGFVVNSGGAFDGYDHTRGHYAVRGMPALATHSFEAFWVNPNEYLTVSFSVKNDNLPRRFYVKHYTSLLDGLEAGVVTDMHGFPLPIPVQVCKNFDGEHKEPDDTGFGESYFPLSLKPGQELDLRSYHLHQNWGNSPLTQVSSVRFYEHYYTCLPASRRLRATCRSPSLHIRDQATMWRISGA